MSPRRRAPEEEKLEAREREGRAGKMITSHMAATPEMGRTADTDSLTERRNPGKDADQMCI